MPFLQKPGQAGFQSWNVVSYLLASFVLLTIATNLYLSREVMGVHAASVKTNADWAAELKQLTKLEALAQKIVAPGYDVFDTNDPGESRNARDVALADFFEFMKGLEDKSALLRDRDKRNRFHADLQVTNKKVNLMVNAEDRIFQYFELDQKERAARHMVIMSRRFAEVVSAITGLIHLFQDYKVADLEAQKLAAEQFGTYSKLLGAAILVLVLFVVWYGRKVSNLMQVHDRELTLKSALLSTTLENMAQGIVVLDADHRLVASNSRYETMFGFPPGFVAPGKTFEEITRFRVQAGQFGEGNEDEIVKARTAGRGLLERNAERTLPNGLAYVYHRRPMPNGGMVMT